MNSQDIFSKIAAQKTVILYVITGGFVLFAVIGAIMAFASESPYSSYTQVLFPLIIYGIATILSVDALRRLSSDNKIVKIFGLLTIILGALTVVLLSLVFWGVIKQYETVDATPYTTSAYSSSSYMSSFSDYGVGITSYPTAKPSMLYKIIMILPGLVAFTFGGAIILDLKENQKVLKFLKPVSLSLMALATIIWVITSFITMDDYSAQIRVQILQSLSWLVAIFLGATAYYLSRSTAYDERENSTINTSPTNKPFTDSTPAQGPDIIQPDPLYPDITDENSPLAKGHHEEKKVVSLEEEALLMTQEPVENATSPDITDLLNGTTESTATPDVNPISAPELTSAPAPATTPAPTLAPAESTPASPTPPVDTTAPL